MADRILVVDDESIIRESLSFILTKEGFEVTEAVNGKEAFQKIVEQTFDLVISDIEMPEMKGIELLDKIIQVSPQTIVVIITAYGSLETAIQALRKGASDYLLKPIEFDEILVKINRLLEHKKLVVENQVLRRELQRKYDFNKIIGKSTSMKKVYEMIEIISPTNSNVLVTGNSGTGKELVARAIHFNSKKKAKPFIVVNCGAIPENLIESELFGHKKGAFTGAVSDKIGFFKAADGGTLFLDEISEMPLQLQVKLLRSIQEKEITPVGTSTTIPIDVRIISSTNRNLLKEIKENRFREDLYYRINVVEINLPSLKERKEDIPILVDHFINKYRHELGKKISGADNRVMNLLMNHEWKGEVRELENIIERAAIFCQGEFISIKDLPEFLSASQEYIEGDEEKSLENAINDFEKNYILSVLRNNNFDKEKTANDLKIGLSTLYRRIKDLDIQT